MVKTLRESKAKLSELVERASRGEDVLITVRGKVKARLTKAEDTEKPIDTKQWVRELQAIQKAVTARTKPKVSTEQIIDEIREDRI